MKKFLAILAIAGVMVSCNNKKKDEKKETTTDSVTTTTPTTTTPTTTDNTNTPTTTDNSTGSADIPKFKDPEVQKYVDDYTAFITSYVNAYKSKDMTKVSTYATEYQQWIGKTQSVAMKLSTSPEEADKFSKYMTKLNHDVQAAMKMQ
jgi:hypothetical protein